MSQYNKHKTIIANWKMNPKSYDAAINLLDLYIENINNNKINLNNMDLIIAPPAIYLQSIYLKLQKFQINNIYLSAQNNNETNELIAKKCLTAIGAGLTPVICVGETKIEFDNQETWQVLSKQLEFLKNINNNFLIAYEPVWAIGTGVTADLSYIIKVSEFIKERFNTRDIKVLYGGSVNEVNAKTIFQLVSLDGALVGGGSLDPNQFAKICE